MMWRKEVFVAVRGRGTGDNVPDPASAHRRQHVAVLREETAMTTHSDITFDPAAVGRVFAAIAGAPF